ncbi:hypothetical protein L6267_03230 [Candidatus Parcubacteria bacterium]|nr:hypothetical protein [Candidatus Parcubacteria bacterium]
MSVRLNDLTNIFYSNYNGRIEYDKLQKLIFALKNNVINLTKFPAANISKYEKNLKQIYGKTIKTCDFEGGGKGHLALKIIASDYIKSLNKKVKYEYKFQGRLIDVVSQDLSIIIECGDTDPIKIFDYFEDEDNKVRQILILPYPSNGNKELFFYKFKKDKNFEQYKKCVNEVMLSDIRNAMSKRRIH